jgi:hypothetical protein
LIEVTRDHSPNIGQSLWRNASILVYFAWTGVVSSQGKSHVAVVAVEHLAEVTSASWDVLPGIEGIGDT